MNQLRLSSYPDSIADAIRQRWGQLEYPTALLPPEQSLTQLVDSVYQASLLREETEQVQCRIALCEPEAFVKHLEDGCSRIHVIRFAEECILTPHQIRKLAAAADYYRSLLAVRLREDGTPYIWGIISSGTKWANRVDTFEGSEHRLPVMLVLHAVGPGHLIASAGDARLLEMTGGRTLLEGFDPFRSNWLPYRFGDTRSKLMRRAEDALAGTALAGVTMCEEFPRDLAQSVVRRTLRIVRNRGHGGMLIYIPESVTASQQLQNWFRFRVLLEKDESTLRFQHLMVQIIRRAREVGHSQGLSHVTYRDYRRMEDGELSRCDEALIELAHFFADLLSVDGAVILDRSYRLIGFGAEVLGDSHVSLIHQALDLEATETLEVRADSSGTRHRSAYRLVSGLADTIAVVVSQDGDVRFVATHNGKLTFWPYLP